MCNGEPSSFIDGYTPRKFNRGGRGEMRYLVVVLCLLALTGCTPPTPGSKPEPVNLRATPDPGTNWAAIIGDSYTSGSPQGGHGPQSWAALLKSNLHDDGVELSENVGAVGASGYVAPGHFSAGVFADQIGRVVGTNDNLVIIFGSRNDAKVPADDLTQAVHTALVKVHDMAPKAKVLLISPAWAAWSTYPPSVDMVKVRDVLKTEAELTGATLLDPIADKWFADRPDVIGEDGVHPTDEGHVYMAERITPVVKQLLAVPVA